MRMPALLPPIIVQIIGVLLAVFVPVFWAVTGRLEPLLLGFSITLISIGTVSQARKGLKDIAEAEDV